MTPDQVHYCHADAIRAARQISHNAAYPERVVNTPPKPPPKPTTEWINPPQMQAQESSLN